MKIATPGQMNAIDRYCIDRLGIPGVVLMENAAQRVVDAAVEMVDDISGKRIVILAGKGNNGGDAFAVARHLLNKDALLSVYSTQQGIEENRTEKDRTSRHEPFIGSSSRNEALKEEGIKKEALKEVALEADALKNGPGNDAEINMRILNRLGIKISSFFQKSDDSGQLKSTSHQMLSIDFLSSLSCADLIIDGLLGTGLRGAVGEPLCPVIDAVNASGVPVLAIDIPSGVNGETGAVSGSCIKALRTVTFCLPKMGLLLHPGSEHVGKLDIVDIGIPKPAVEMAKINAALTDAEGVSPLIPKRTLNSNKGDYGKVLIVTGSEGMTGAGCLSAMAALRSGSGLVYIGVPASLSIAYDTAVLEAITLPLQDDGKGRLSNQCTPSLLDRMKGMNALAVGPGLSVSDEIRSVIIQMINRADVPLVIDADALNAISKDPAVLLNLKAGGIVTPHPGEMARLTGHTIKEVQEDRLKVAQSFAMKYGVVTVLKGFRTIVASPDGRIAVNSTGNPGMATAGTGDVLTGIILSLCGQGMNPFDAATAGVYIHGACGDRAVLQKGMHGLIAGDLTDYLPEVMKDLSKG